MKFNTLYSRSTTGKILTFTIEVDGGKYRTISGQKDGAKTTTKWTICFGKNIGKKNETTPEQQAIIQAEAIFKKKKEAGAFERIEDVDLETFFKPMLAFKWKEKKDKVKFPLFSQPKLDGIRCIVRKDGMWSRKGKRILSAPHIYNSLKHLFDENPDLIFDGELYADKFSNDFNSICSLVRKQKPTKEDLIESEKSIEYWIYDLPSKKDIFSRRIDALAYMDLPECCKKVETEIIRDENELQELYEWYVENGYEGQMIRDDALYENKRTNSLLKNKSFIDEEYIIVDVEEGIGNRTGMVGALIFRNNKGTKLFKANLKFNWKECIELWERKEELIGKSATVKYFNLTPDGVPRFPFVVQIGREEYE